MSFLELDQVVVMLITQKLPLEKSSCLVLMDSVSVVMVETLPVSNFRVNPVIAIVTVS